jgi:D-glycero-D-manno-heptose 1,7-bisphosphate phosphatase
MRPDKKQTNVHPLSADGVWCEIRSRARNGRAALFLDRDGVVVEEVGYLHRIDDIIVIPEAVALVAAANRKGIPVVLVTNQAGVAHGLYSWTEFAAVQQAILLQLAAQGGEFDAVFAAPHHPEGRAPYAHPDHPARKPNPGMLLAAADELALDLPNSWLVGDRASDIEAAKRAGLAGALLIPSGHGLDETGAALAHAGPTFDVRVGRSITDAMMLPIMKA